VNRPKVGQLAHVVGEHPFIDVPDQVERLNADVYAVQAALEQAPEVLQPSTSTTRP
jgi:hypothetical protein